MNKIQSNKPKLYFLKLGGSLITDKASAHTPRLDVIRRLAIEIKTVRDQMPELKLILGHGSGSFGHIPAKKFGTRQGVATKDAWLGFAEVWWEASSLNRIVLDALHEAKLPAISFPASGAVSARDGKVTLWNLAPLKAALAADLLPVVSGDVVFDSQRGGTILSTEDIFNHLGISLHPHRILLAGIEEGVWADYPKCKHLISTITQENWDTVAPSLGGSQATDVTGGMVSKVQGMLELTAQIPGVEVHIFSGKQSGNLIRAMLGESTGTKIYRKEQLR
jgi:isopentenyl phosphate kinase